VNSSPSVVLTRRCYRRREAREAVFQAVNCMMPADGICAAAEKGISARPVGSSKLNDTIVVVTSRCSHEFEPPLPNSISKEVLEPLRHQGGIARRVLDVAVSEIGLDRARVVAIVGELVAAGVAQHVGMRLDAQIGRHMREKPGADSGAPRSETNTKGDCALSR
jgi:hypothetical protein